MGLTSADTVNDNGTLQEAQALPTDMEPVSSNMEQAAPTPIDNTGVWASSWYHRNNPNLLKQGYDYLQGATNRFRDVDYVPNVGNQGAVFSALAPIVAQGMQDSGVGAKTSPKPHMELLQGLDEKYLNTQEKLDTFKRASISGDSAVQDNKRYWDQQDEYDRVLDGSSLGGLAGVGASMVLGSLDPTIFMTGPKVLASWRALGKAPLVSVSTASAMGEVAVAGGKAIVTQEGINELLAPEQKDLTDHVVNTVAGAAFGAIVGGGARYVGPRARERFNKIFSHYMKSDKILPEDEVWQTTSGLVADDTKATGMNDIVSFIISGGVRGPAKMVFSEDPNTRFIVNQLVDHNYEVAANAEGKSAVIDGASVEAELRQVDVEVSKMQHEVEKIYTNYAVPDSYPFAANTKAAIKGYKDPNFSFQSTIQEVAHLLNNRGLESERPHVNKIRDMYAKVLDDDAAALVKAGELSADDVRSDFYRWVFRDDAIVANRPKYEANLFENLKERQQLDPEYELYDSSAPKGYAAHTAKHEDGKQRALEDGDVLVPKIGQMTDQQLKDFVRRFVEAQINGEGGRGGMSGLQTTMELHAKATKDPSFLRPRTDWMKHKYVEEFLNNNADQVVNRYHKDAQAALRIKDRFEKVGKELGKPELNTPTAFINHLTEEASKAASKLPPKKRQAYMKKRMKEVDDILSVVSLLKGRSINKTSITNPILDRSLGYVRKYELLTHLGSMTWSAISDTALPILVHGPGQDFFRAYANAIGDRKSWNGTKGIARDFGSGIDLSGNRILQAMEQANDMNGNVTHKSFLDNVIDAATSNFQSLTLNKQWTNFGKRLSLDMGTHRTARLIEKWAKTGVMSKYETKRLAQLGLDKSLWKELSEEILRMPKGRFGSRVIELGSFKNQALAKRFGMGHAKEVDSIILTPGLGDVPLWMQKSGVARTLFQFTSFMSAFTQRVVTTAIQRKDMKSLIGMAAYLGMQGMQSQMKNFINDREVEFTPDQFFRDALSNSGAFGMVGNKGNQLYDMFVADKKASRFKDANKLGLVLGPFGGDVEKGFYAARDKYRGDDEQAWKKAQTLVPYQNLWWTRILLRKVFNQ